MKSVHSFPEITLVYIRDIMEKNTMEYQLPKDIDPEKLPVHIAIIMDGNGRWAKERGLPRFAGHKAGVDSLREIVRLCGKIGIKVLTVYAFSSENWKRPKTEVNGLMRLLQETLSKYINELDESNVRLSVIGRSEQLPPKVQQAIEKAKEKLSQNTGLHYQVALNYGGRTEIVDAVRSIAMKVKNSDLDPDKIDEDDIQNHLYTSGVPDPDLVIRTSGEMRISNYLLWQIAYSELFVTPTYWPAFTPESLFEALRDYQSRSRRFGGLKK